MVWKQVRELNARYEDRLDALQKEYLDALNELQDSCSHEKQTRWTYELDTYGELASTAYGVAIKYRECRNCGLVESKVDDTNDYDSEIPL